MKKALSGMSNRLIRKAYRGLNKCGACDITEVLLLELEACQRPGNDVRSFEFRFLSADDVRRFSTAEAGDLEGQMADMIERREAQCFAALEQDRLAAYTWFAKNRILAEHNAGGIRFAGIGLTLPEDMVYLFKAYVLPEYRGQALNNWIFYHAGEQFRRKGANWMITTTDWTNKPFQTSARRGGFTKRAHAAEWIIGGKHFYCLPKLDIPGLEFFGGAA